MSETLVSPYAGKRGERYAIMAARLVRLNDGCYINREDVQEVKISGSGHGDIITVRMRNGVGHATLADHGKSVQETLSRLVAELEGTAAGQVESPEYRYAVRLATAIASRLFPLAAFQPLPDLMGVLTQIDNMTAPGGLNRYYGRGE